MTLQQLADHANKLLKSGASPDLLVVFDGGFTNYRRPPVRGIIPGQSWSHNRVAQEKP